MSKRKMQWLAVLLVAVMGSVSDVSAATLTWALKDGVWSDTTGWGTGIIPGSADYAAIRGGKTVTVDYATPTITGILVGESSTSTGTVNIVAGGSITQTVKSEIGRKSTGLGGEGWLNISGGSFISVGTAPLSIGDEVAAKHVVGHLNISGGTLTSTLTVGSNIAGDAGDTMTVIGDAATITGGDFGLKASGKLSFIFDASGISTMAYTGAATNAVGSQIIVDGTAYTGGANTFNLITAGTLLGAQNCTVVLTNFANTATLDWGVTTPGIVSVSVIPEPATIGMLGLGAIAMLAIRRYTRS